MIDLRVHYFLIALCTAARDALYHHETIKLKLRNTVSHLHVNEAYIHRHETRHSECQSSI